MEGKGEPACKVCGDKASGKHYGVPSCDGCRGFFKRSIRRGLAYHCKESGACVVDVTRRNQCQACRFKKCLAVNMKRDAVQHERAPRTSLPNLSPAPRPGPRAPTYPFPHQPSPYLTSTPLLDLSPYHLIYPQPTFPFPFSVSSRMGLGLGVLGSTHTTHSLRTEPTFSTTESKVSGAGEEEVTSSEEAKDLPNQNICPLTRDSHQDLWRGVQATTDQAVYESAAKLLFLTVKWARSIPSFLQLSFQDQSALLEESWSDLFILSAAQWALPIDEVWMKSGQVESESRRENLEKETRRLKQAICRLMMSSVDHTEYACLKALTLFKSDVSGLRNQAQIELIQEQTLTMLHDYCAARETHKARFGKLLLLLPSVNNLSKDLIEEVLFRKTIGNVSIERVLSDMLKSNTTV